MKGLAEVAERRGLAAGLMELALRLSEAWLVLRGLAWVKTERQRVRLFPRSLLRPTGPRRE